MKTNKLTFLTVATIATAIFGIKGVNADEFDPGNITENTTITVGAENARSEKEGTIPSEVRTEHEDSQSGEGDPTDTEATRGGDGLPTNFEKSGNVIEVKNPKVVIEQPEGNGRYTPFKVKYENIKIPDNIEVNEGDKVTFDLPQEVKFQTSYEFDVHNPENAVVGQATADSQAGTVTTVFNDYFKNHSLNKQMSLKMDAKWTDKVQSGKPVTANFNGTVVTAQIGKEQEIGSNELLSKWGSQDENDPTVINWTVRVNYARKVLNYVKIIDEMSENQKLVDDYFEIKNIESVDPWIDKGSAMDLVKSISKSDHGFEIKMDRLDRMIYLNYKTKLTSAVKDSVNPTNKVELKAEDSGAVSYSYVQLVGGRGDASGENKPVWEIPNDAPKYEKPSIDLNDIPLMPPAPVLEKPEWKGGTTPFDAPQIDKPEWKGGVVPFDAPVLDKPELEIPDEPVKPSPEPKQNQPQPKPEPKQDKPNTPDPKETPKTEEVKINNRAENHAKITRNESEEAVEAYSAPAVLPATGSDLGLSLVALGISVATLAFTLKKKEN